jgi:hypothetical protein
MSVQQDLTTVSKIVWTSQDDTIVNVDLDLNSKQIVKLVKKVLIFYFKLNQIYPLINNIRLGYKLKDKIVYYLIKITL